MKALPKLSVLLFILAISSCQKKFLCPDCEINKPPIALAGPDQIIGLPKDSTFLDGNNSNDPDGKIVSYKWTKISNSFISHITNSDSVKTIIKGLVLGKHQFELKVTDDKGASAKDTMMIIVSALPPSNQPPVACAGADQTITLPTNSAILDGSCSSDPDNNITVYTWSKISGPTSFNIANANAVQTQISGLIEGIYQFELLVTDAGGLFSKDTFRLSVNSINAGNACGETNRPRVYARLVEVGTLSLIRANLAVASANDKILFAGGGYQYNNLFSTRVDIYNITTNTWSTAELSHPRFDIAAVAAGNKIFFAGGSDTDGSMPRDNVDVYDASTNTWSLMKLSRRDECIAAAAVGNKILFAGGCYNSLAVDIYDVIRNTWSVVTLPEPMSSATAVTVGNKVYFAGGNCKTSIVYDNATNSWSTFPVQKAKKQMAGINVGNKIYWAGGICDTVAYCSVEIHDLNTGGITQQSLSAPRVFWKNGGQNAVVKDNKIIFYRSSLWENANYTDNFDIYDIGSNTWSIGVLPFRIEATSIISVNNVVYLAGGFVNGVLSNKVYKLEF